MLLLFRIPPVHLQRRYMLLSFRFAPLREWERQKENLIAFMEEANRLLLLVLGMSMSEEATRFRINLYESKSMPRETIMFFYNFFFLL